MEYEGWVTEVEDDLLLDVQPRAMSTVDETAALQEAEEAQHDNEVSEAELEEDQVTQKHKATKRKMEQQSKFNEWKLKHAKQITDAEIKALQQNVSDEKTPVYELMQRDHSRIISDPREYQLELFERAKGQNIIAVLDTGSGKTLIAVLLLRHIIDQELKDRARGKKPRVAFFLVDCVTLVFQQFAVLQSNLDQPIERFCGEMGCNLWVQQTWQRHLQQNKIIVCTAEILYQCLMHSFIGMDQINLLIFDEAHHAKKNHAYARIIKDFYISEEDTSKRPKIFGMTASPVDVRGNYDQAAKELESMLHAQIATTADLSLLRMSISRPNENVAVYSKLQFPYVTSLCNALKSRFGVVEPLAKIFKFALEATSQLGEWCADQVWRFALAELETLKIERKIERRFSDDRKAKPVSVLDAQLRQVREAQSFVNEWKFRDPVFEGNDISSKVMVLRNYLNLIFERPTDARCIVFVHRRYTARLLKEIFHHIGSPHLRIGLLVGTRYGDPGDLKVSFREQILTLMKFRKGELNCLFATSIAEEGLDIPDCNLVVRFDLYTTLIQYIQSRGRARHANSKYIHMIEDGNQSHLQGIREVQMGENVMRRFCEALPADRLLQGNDANLESAMAKERNLLRSYVDPDSGAKLTYASSLVVLAHFVSRLPEVSTGLTFAMTVEHGQYTCEVVLPENSPIHSAIGRPASTKAIAKRSAAFEACLLLRQGRYLDANLVSTYQKHLPAMRNAHLALNMSKSSLYDMRIKPILWQNTRGSRPKALYMTILALEVPTKLGRPSQPLAILTRTRLPEFPPILMHVQLNQTSHMLSISMQESLKLSDTILERLTSFTLRIFRDVFNKEYETNEPGMSYWLAPVAENPAIWNWRSDPRKVIDWETLNYVAENNEWQWDTDQPNEKLANRYVVDKWDGGRRFFSIGVVPNLRATDPVPDDAATHKYMGTIINYSVSLFPRARAKAVWKQDQPVFFAHRIIHRLNWLDEYNEQQKTANVNAYLCPEPLLFSALPVSVASMAYLFPSAISRIESYLIAVEVCDLLGLSVRPDLALEAITKDSDNTEEHRSEQTHLQRGMGKNYERLEFIGDCFLKMATSISIFCISPENDEFEYHVRRMLLICNKNLFNVAIEKKLFEYIRSVGFSRRNWYPQGIKLLKGKGFNKTGEEIHKHQLGDKTIADVCEAIIGASLLSYRDSGSMDMAVKAVTALVSDPDHAVSEWADYYKLYSKPAYQIAQASAVQADLALQIEEKMGYRFRYPRLLFSAFVHPSVSSLGGIPCYQRLEFLGDALLDMACVNFLFDRHPERDPQWLTEHKMAMVSNKFLAALSAKLGFHRHLRFSGQIIEWQNREYVQEIEEAERESGGAADYWTTTKAPPKCLSDILESYLGALFVDSSFSFSQITQFFISHVQPFFEDMSLYDTFANNHPTTFLHNLLSLSFGCQNYRIMAQSFSRSPEIKEKHQVAVVMVHGQVIADAMAASSKNAKVKASEKALGELRGLAPFEYRARYGCDCAGEEKVELEDVGTAI